MKKILVTYATNAGSTAEVALTIGEEIRKSGAQVDVLPLENVTGLVTFDAVVLGAPMIMGWHRGAVGFLKKNQKTLSQVPVVLFIMAMNLTRTGEKSIDNVPVFIDPNLPKNPKIEGKLTFKERYSNPANYLGPVLKSAPQIKPVSVAFFGGNLAINRLKWWAALFAILIIQAQPGDKRNWDAIREWAGGLASMLDNSAEKGSS
jgi:menaquinone-dependent protoporphyrinogen oxidase